MTLPIERARSRRPITWLTVLGVLLLPAIIGGVLVAALYDPTERLDGMSAAIVNLDEPVTIDDQTTPLGRALAGGLVEGTDEVDSNVDWVLSNEEDAAAGLADGSYQAVLTIPEEFSASATSPGQSLSGQDKTPQQATITVQTAPDSLIVDDALTQQIADTAAATLGRSVSESTLANLFVGYTTLGDQLGEAASGAGDLGDGARSAQDGAVQLADGATQLADGAGELGAGATQVADGVSELGTGAGGIADGASGLQSGAGRLADGAGRLADGIRDAQGGAGELASGLHTGADALEADGLVPTELSSAAATSADASGQIAEGLGALSAQCVASGAAAEFCAQLGQLQAGAEGAALAAGGTSEGLAQFDTQASAEIAGQLRSAGAGADQLASGLSQLADGADQSAAGAAELGSGASRLADGATQLASGATQLAAGADQVATGTTGLADGADELATGAGDLGDGIGELAGGGDDLADGLTEASASLPSYSDGEAEDLASVVADPVSTSGAGLSLFGASSVPLLTAVALWFGALATFVALRPITARALGSRRPSGLLAARGLLPAALIGAAQGLLVAAIVQLAASYDAGTWWAFAGLAALAGVAFAAVQQALVAVFGGIGRWLAALVGALAVATGIVSTVPGVLAEIAGFLPTAPAYDAMLAVLAGTGGVGVAVVGMLIWAALAFVATTLAVARRRTASVKALLAASPA